MQNFFFSNMTYDKYICIKYMCEGHSLSKLKSSEIKVGKIGKILFIIP